MNFELKEKPLKLKKVKELAESLIIIPHNEKDLEKDFIGEFNEEREKKL